MKVYAQTMLGKMYPIEIPEEGLLGKEIKLKVQEVDGIYWHDITMVFRGNIIEDTKNILEYQVKEGDKLHILVKYTKCSCEPCRKR
jgi:hypothetical protein